MTVAPLTPPPARLRTTDALFDGAIAGVVAAMVLILWSLALDLAQGRELPSLVWVPAIVLERLAEATGGLVPRPRSAATGVLLLSVGCIVLGEAVAWLLTRFRRAPTAGITLMVSFAALQLAFFALDGATGAGLFARLRPWAVLAANALAAGAMTLTVWKRRPRLTAGRRDLWDDEP
jgi:hypothetical protein